MTDQSPAWRDLSIYLGRQGVAVDDLIRAPGELEEVELAPAAGIAGRLWFLPIDDDPTPPAWMVPLGELAVNLPRVRTSLPGAILAFERDGRVLVVTFGRGHQRLRVERFEPDFGLRIAGNWLAPDDVVSVDSRAVEQAVFLTRRHASAGTSIGSLGVETVRESVQSLTGAPADAARGRRVTGRVAVHLTRSVSPADLSELGRELLAAYAATDYETAFPAIEQRRRVDDPADIDELDQLIATGLLTANNGGAYLAPPELIDWANVAGFRLRGDPPGERRPALDLDDYLAGAGLDRLDAAERLQRLRDDSVSLVARDTGTGPRWPIYRALIAQRELRGQTYVLADGHWWRIHPEFIGWVDEQLAQMPESGVVLPPYQAIDADEEAYNARAAGELAGATSLDSNLASFQGERGTVELCDIAGPGRRLIHVKRGVRSQSLSHLFAQAFGSAEVLRHMPSARRQLRQKLEARLPEVAASISDDAMNARAWEVVIAIVAPPARVPNRLPFFSRAHLARTVRDITRLDYRVTYRAIEPPA
jgi:uncharacterized protein (TIGR04141 family)